MEHLTAERFVDLGLNLDGGMELLIDLCLECKVISSKNCSPHPNFTKYAGEEITGIMNEYLKEDRYLEMLLAAFAKARALKTRVLPVPELLNNVAALILYLIPPAKDEQLKGMMNAYECESQTTIPDVIRSAAPIIVYIGAVIEQRLTNDEYLKVDPDENGIYIATLREKCFA